MVQNLGLRSVGSVCSASLTQFVVLVQAARELVLEVIREKDGDFRSGRSDFGGRLGGANLDVRRSPTDARRLFCRQNR